MPTMPLSAVLGAVLIIVRRQRRRRQRGTIGNYEVINRAAVVSRHRMVWSEREDSLSDMDFVWRYHMGKDCFGDLVRVLQPILDPTTPGSNGSQRVPTELCLSLTLRIVAGGSYLVRITDFLHKPQSHLHHAGRRTSPTSTASQRQLSKNTFGVP
jgi:hypothetical protein